MADRQNPTTKPLTGLHKGDLGIQRARIAPLLPAEEIDDAA